MLLTVRGRVDQWSTLLWDRALAMRIVEATLTLDTVLPPPARERRIAVTVPRLSARLAARPRRPGPEVSRGVRRGDGRRSARSLSALCACAAPVSWPRTQCQRTRA